MADSVPIKAKHQSLLFIGLATVVVLLPFPNIFGLAFDAAILALAYPMVGARTSLVLVLLYNFNPLKANGLITLYYVLSGALGAVLPLPPPAIGAVIVGLMVVGSVVEFGLIRMASSSLWKLLIAHDPRMRLVFERATTLW